MQIVKYSQTQKDLDDDGNEKSEFVLIFLSLMIFLSSDFSQKADFSQSNE